MSTPAASPFRPTSAWDDPLRVPDDYQVPTTAQLVEMPLHQRRQALMLLQSYDHEFATDHVGAYRREQNRCTDVDEFGHHCDQTRWDGIMHCLSHATADELSPSSATERRVRAARLKLVDKLESAADQLIRIIEADPEEVTAQVRLNAITMLMDRTGLPRETAQTIDAHVDVTHHETAGATIRARIEQLRSAAADPAPPSTQPPGPAANGETQPARPELLPGSPAPDDDEVYEGVIVDE